MIEHLEFDLWGFHLGTAPIVVSFLVIIMLIGFFLFYFIPCIRILWQIGRCSQALERIKVGGGIARTEDIERLFIGRGPLEHAWFRT